MTTFAPYQPAPLGPVATAGHTGGGVGAGHGGAAATASAVVSVDHAASIIQAQVSHVLATIERTATRTSSAPAPLGSARPLTQCCVRVLCG